MTHRAAVFCAIVLPMAVMAGSAVAAARQPPGYDPLSQTISALASQGATDRWIMTGTLAVLGLGYVVIALGLGPVPVRGRVVLGGGGLAVLLVALLPQPAGASSPWHMGAATVGWVAFTLWPSVVCRRSAEPGLLGWRVSWIVTGTLFVLLGWFFVELRSAGAYLGLAERVLVVAQTLWPLTVVLALRRPAGTAHRVEPEELVKLGLLDAAAQRSTATPPAKRTPRTRSAPPSPPPSS